MALPVGRMRAKKVTLSPLGCYCVWSAVYVCPRMMRRERRQKSSGAQGRPKPFMTAIIGLNRVVDTPSFPVPAKTSRELASLHYSEGSLIIHKAPNYIFNWLAQYHEYHSPGKTFLALENNGRFYRLQEAWILAWRHSVAHIWRAILKPGNNNKRDIYGA